MTAVGGHDGGASMLVMSAADLAEIGDAGCGGAELPQEVEPVDAQSRIIGIDLDMLKKRIDSGTQCGQRAHGTSEILGGNCGSSFGNRFAKGGVQFLLLR